MLDGLTHSAIDAEVIRAQAKHGRPNTAANPELDRGVKLAILMEEVGEVSHEICEHALGKIFDEELHSRLVKELIQVSAVAAAWAEAEDKLI